MAAVGTNGYVSFSVSLMSDDMKLIIAAATSFSYISLHLPQAPTSPQDTSRPAQVHHEATKMSSVVSTTT